MSEPIAPEPLTSRWHAVLRTMSGLLVGTAGLFLATSGQAGEVADVPPPPQVSTVEAPVFEDSLVPVEDVQASEDRELIAGLSNDTWLHPLAGPTRRMPRSHSGAFGAERPGERPPECVSGHCGVDLGHTWGEPVLAVHEGVVEFVQRGPNEERGGKFVRISHRGGTLYSWYFHLAAIPKWVQRGATVHAGQVIGLLGDTGVKHSAPHLHFALSVKPSTGTAERYLDPEPLIAIWPVWIPEGEGGRVSPLADPGIPVRGDRPKRRAKKERAPDPAPDGSESTMNAPA